MPTTPQCSTRAEVSQSTVAQGSAESPLELWAGSECTVNRVGDRYYDQSRRLGHLDRLQDIDRLAALGARRVRFPVLWESVAPGTLSDADFSFCDSRLSRLRELGIQPIIGLVHHGSGPPGRTLDSADFASGLAAFARCVAERYPWVQDYTPINEPLTTARFCGLYGHWYPHRRDTASFLQLLVNETLATAAAMRAIRQVTAGARLIQTEDLGRSFSTPRLAYQRNYENHRRWLSLDLLDGRLNREHPLREHLEQNGIAAATLDGLVEAPCPPDLIGVNYYLTSDRFLDEHLERYPAHLHGGNGRDAYVDVEAVRVYGRGTAGHERVLREVWDRYRLPVAISEVHLGCTREEQLRWLAEAWQAAQHSRERGVDVRAVTLWAAFGSVDWNVLLTRESGHYESGAYDIRGRTPRPTALAKLARELSLGEEPSHPVLSDPGWWHRPQRLLHPVYGPARFRGSAPKARSILVVGDSVLGDSLRSAGTVRGLTMERVSTRAEALARVETNRAWAVVLEPLHTLELELLARAQTQVARLAQACRARGLHLVVFSSDRVFDGTAQSPYVETDTTRPSCTHGRALEQMESAVREELAHALVVRTGPLLAPNHPTCRLREMLDAAARSQSLELGEDELISPTFVPHLSQAVLDLLIDWESGIWHLANTGVVTWSELVGLTARKARCAAALTAELTWRSQKPSMRALSSDRGALMPSLELALEGYVSMLHSPREGAKVA